MATDKAGICRRTGHILPQCPIFLLMLYAKLVSPALTQNLSHEIVVSKPQHTTHCGLGIFAHRCSPLYGVVAVAAPPPACLVQLGCRRQAVGITVSKVLISAGLQLSFFPTSVATGHAPYLQHCVMSYYVHLLTAFQHNVNNNGRSNWLSRSQPLSILHVL